MALSPVFVVRRTFVDLAADERPLPRGRFCTDSVLSNLKLSGMDDSFLTDCTSTDDGASDGSPYVWADEESEDEDSEVDERTTVMLQGLDLTLDRAGLLRVLHTSSFCGSFDFIYVPCDFQSFLPQGFGVVNFTSHRDALSFQRQPPVELGNVRVLWSDKEQGLSENVERYRNSPVMHASVPDCCRPSLVQGDELAPLPMPTKAIKAPKIKKRTSRPELCA
jgi:hypothetical protein